MRASSTTLLRSVTPPLSMSEVVLDSSAILAALRAEPGAEKVVPLLDGALLSTVNLAEVIAKLSEYGMPANEAQQAVEALGVQLIDFDAELACRTATLRRLTRTLGLSLGDRACLAVAQRTGRQAVTADRAWGALPGFDIVLIR